MQKKYKIKNIKGLRNPVPDNPVTEKKFGLYYCLFFCDDVPGGPLSAGPKKVVLKIGQ